MKLFKNNRQLNTRRESALKRLQVQLVSKVKPEKALHPLTLVTTGGNEVPLTDQDIERINKEIKILQSRIVRTQND